MSVTIAVALIDAALVFTRAAIVVAGSCPLGVPCAAVRSCVQIHSMTREEGGQYDKGGGRACLLDAGTTHKIEAHTWADGDIAQLPAHFRVNSVAPGSGCVAIKVTTVVGGQLLVIMCVRSIRAPNLTFSATYSPVGCTCVRRSRPCEAITCWCSSSAVRPV